MGDAVRVLEGELEAGMDAEDTWRAFLRFGRRLFDVPDTPESDGLLFQYGTYAFDGPPAFRLDLVRQFEIVDGEGAYDHYVQVHCELRYEPVPALEDLGAFDAWFFHGTGEDLDEWAARLAERPVWEALRPFGPVEARVYQERV
ncbi:hypothetical protein [Streptomyces sp. S1]|uniref:hypothetical protein n=1 Tax=Streptomyces sp. S1 TaxID=718288 RepID=UPI001F0888AC|nr:hypothetical protein [Streptomyces sp. S1]